MASARKGSRPFLWGAGRLWRACRLWPGCAEMIGKKGLDLTQQRHAVLFCAERVIRIRDGYEPVHLPGAFQGGVHILGLLERYLGVRIAVQDQQGNLEFGRMR